MTGHSVIHHLRHSINQTALKPGSRLLVAVSGGLDSVVLLDALVQLMQEFDFTLHVFHLDHQLRCESRADADFVCHLCQSYELDCRIVVADVRTEAQQRGMSLEMAGRSLRRRHLLSLAKTLDAARILLAHHRDDQAETFMLRLLRGTGTRGLQAMREFTPPWWRPLLEARRQQLHDYARHRRLSWVEDASNADLHFLRNRVRHQLLPLMRKENPRISEHLAGLSRQLQQEEDYWQQQLIQLWPQLVVVPSFAIGLPFDGDLRLARKPLMAAHPALQVRLLQAALAEVRGGLQGISRAHLLALIDLVASSRVQAELDLPGCWAARRYQTLWLRRSAPGIVPFSAWLNPGDSYLLPDGRRLRTRCESRSQGESSSRVEFDLESLHFPLQLRSLQRGERFIPAGMTGHCRIKKYLIEHKIEKEQRRQLPILLSGQQILWLVGLRRSALARVAESSGKILALWLENPPSEPTNCL